MAEPVPRCPRCSVEMPGAQHDGDVCTIPDCECGGGPWSYSLCDGCFAEMLHAKMADRILAGYDE